MYLILLFTRTFLLPIAITFIFNQFLVKNLIFIVLLPLMIAMIDIEKTVSRVKHSPDMKYLHMEKFTLSQYVIAKDIIKSYSRLLTYSVFIISFFVFYLSSGVDWFKLLMLLLSLSLLTIGYYLRLQLIYILSLFYNGLLIAFVNYTLYGLILLIILGSYHFNLISLVNKNHIIFLTTLSMFIYLGVAFILKKILSRFSKGTISILYDPEMQHTLKEQRKKSNSVTSKSLLKYELLLLVRNPPVGLGVIFFVLTLSFSLLGGFIYVYKSGLVLISESGNVTLFSAVMFPAIISSFAIQPFVSFDLDGRILPKYRHTPSFIMNKIKTKERISIMFNLLLYIPYTFIAMVFIGNIDFIRMFAMIGLACIAMSISIVTATIAFPYFNWNFFYEVPSTLSKVLLTVLASLVVVIGTVSIVGGKKSSLFAIFALIVLIIFLATINRVLWKTTIEKNFFSFKLLKE